MSIYLYKYLVYVVTILPIQGIEKDQREKCSLGETLSLSSIRSGYV